MNLIDSLKMVVAMLHAPKDEKGATLVEYALVVFLIAIFCIGAVTLAGGAISNIFNTITTSL